MKTLKKIEWYSCVESRKEKCKVASTNRLFNFSTTSSICYLINLMLKWILPHSKGNLCLERKSYPHLLTDTSTNCCQPLHIRSREDLPLKLGLKNCSTKGTTCVLKQKQLVQSQYLVTAQSLCIRAFRLSKENVVHQRKRQLDLLSLRNSCLRSVSSARPVVFSCKNTKQKVEGVCVPLFAISSKNRKESCYPF